MKVELYSKSVDITNKIANIFSTLLNPGDTVAFSGDLGAGKTTFIKQIAECFGIDRDEVTSMSFVLAREYEGALPIMHTDVYRLSDISELPPEILEFVDEQEGVLLMEWAENIDFEALWTISISQERLDERIIEIESVDERIRELTQLLDNYIVRL